MYSEVALLSEPSLSAHDILQSTQFNKHNISKWACIQINMLINTITNRKIHYFIRILHIINYIQDFLQGKLKNSWGGYRPPPTFAIEEQNVYFYSPPRTHEAILEWKFFFYCLRKP